MAEDKGNLIMQLCEKMEDVEPLPDEKEFATSSETLVRFLKARDWKLADSEKLLKAAVEWRRVQRPLRSDCKWCHERPGYHCMRQIGFDEMGRPVIYSCFSQAATHSNSVEDSLAHSTYLIENAKRTMKPGITNWVFIIDCTGMTLPSCNPKLGYGCTQVLSDHYPERLGLVICINHNRFFQSVWSAIKVFLHPNTVAKMQLVRSKTKIRELFEKHFSAEMTEWLETEVKLNKHRPISKSQLEFWKTPPGENSGHDPRGCPSYVSEYIEPYLKKNTSNAEMDLVTHRPHPNIIDSLRGKIENASNSDPNMSVNADSSLAAEKAPECDRNAPECDSSDSDDTGSPSELELPKEFQIPTNAEPLHM